MLEGDADARLVRLGVIFGTALVGLAAVAAALVPLVVRAHRPFQPQVFSGTTDVYAVPFAGGVSRRVLRLHGQWAFPVATPDGRALILLHPTFPAGAQIWRVPLDGGARTLIGSMPVFRKLAFAVHHGPRSAEVRAHLLELVTPHARRVLARDAAGNPPLWTPDGRRLVYDAQDGTLKVLTVATGSSRTLLRRGGDVGLSADGKLVYVLRLKDAVSIPK